MNRLALALLIALTGGIAGIAGAQVVTCSTVPISTGPYTAVQSGTRSSGPYKPTASIACAPDQAGSMLAVWVFENDSSQHTFTISDTNHNQYIQPVTAHQKLSCCSGTGTLFLSFNVAAGPNTIVVTADKAAGIMLVMREYRHSGGILSAIDQTGLGVNVGLTDTPTIALNTTSSGDLILVGNIWSDYQRPTFCPGLDNHNWVPGPAPGGKLIISDGFQVSSGPITECLHAAVNGGAMWAVAIQPAGGGTPRGSITASAGTPQSTDVNTTFATPLAATVKDSNGTPVSGASVTFTTPPNGPTAAFEGSSTVNTNANGLATAPALTANGQTGSYVVTAATPDVPASTSFNLTNTVVVSGGGGSLAGGFTTGNAAASLTGEGTSDWIHWGDSTVNRKAGSAQLSTYTRVGSGTVNTYNNDPRNLSRSDGIPTANSSNNKNGAYISGVGRGFTFSAPADTNPRTLMIHVGGYNSGGTLTA
ncbi:MAG TPA: hypothetical protein VGO07_05675, partial [Candidatus Saccharimonadales bacterium]|nr:hypothetical protein [Candidatus Saccharimonadales bacterium]